MRILSAAIGRSDLGRIAAVVAAAARSLRARWRTSNEGELFESWAQEGDAAFQVWKAGRR